MAGWNDGLCKILFLSGVKLCRIFNRLDCVCVYRGTGDIGTSLVFSLLFSSDSLLSSSLGNLNLEGNGGGRKSSSSFLPFCYSSFLCRCWIRSIRQSVFLIGQMVKPNRQEADGSFSAQQDDEEQ